MFAYKKLYALEKKHRKKSQRKKRETLAIESLLVKGSGKREEEDITCKFKIGSMDTISRV